MDDGVEHDANGLAEGLAGEVLAEGDADGAVVAVGADDGAPDHAVERARRKRSAGVEKERGSR